MKSIFEQAEQVVAWLGPKSVADQKGLDRLKHLEARIVERAIGYDEMVQEFGNVLAGDNGSIGIAIQAIMDLPYFQRIWIQQDFMAAQDVQFMCGKYFCRWDTLSVASAYIKATKRVSTSKVTGQAMAMEELRAEAFGLGNAGEGTDMFRIRSEFLADNHVYSLWDLLLSTKAGDIKSSDPRDAIFALLGLSSDASTLGIKPDYHITAQACYIRVAKLLLLQGRFRLLWLSVQPKKLSDLPSWVPDWSSDWDTTTLGLSYSKRELRWDLPGSDDAQFTASGLSQPSISFKVIDSREALCIRGAFYGRIVGIQAIFGPRGNHPPFGYLRQAFRLTEELAAGYTPDPFSLDPQMILRTLLLGTEIKYYGSTMFTRVEDMNLTSRLSSELSAKLIGHLLDKNQVPNAALQNQRGFLLMKCSLLENRQVFITSQGGLGIASSNIKLGDNVVVFHGTEVPFVVREHSTSCNVISEAYVDGIMDGELMDSGREFVDFQII